MKFLKASFLPLVLMMVMVGCYFIPYYREGLPLSHDGENHVARFAQYYLALKQGQLPPRVAPTLENGFGYPVFNFNYPLANILSLPLSAMKIEFEVQFKILMMGFFVAGGLGVWGYLRQVMPQKVKPVIPLLAFWSAPYLFNAIFIRGSIGEVMIYCLVPLVLLSFERWRNFELGGKVGKIKARKITALVNEILLVVALAMFFLAHNVMVLFLTPLLLFYFGGRMWGGMKEKWKKLGVIFLLALGLASWFWIPALGEKGLIILDQAKINLDYEKHFIALEQLGRISVTAGFSEWGVVDGLSYGLGLIFLLTLGLSVVALGSNKTIFWGRKIGGGLLLLGVGLIFLQLDLSKGIYQVVPFLSYVQFPWRVSLILSLVIVGLLALLESGKNGWSKWWLVVVAGQILVMVNSWPMAFSHKTQLDYLAYPQSTTTLREDTAKTFTYEITGRRGDQPVILRGEGEVKNIKRLDTSEKEYEVSCVSECVVVEQTANFAGFRTWANGQRVELVDDKEIQGRIAYHLGAGDYVIKTKFTQLTPSRMVGNGITLVAVGVLIYKLVSQVASFSRLTKRVK